MVVRITSTLHQSFDFASLGHINILQLRVTVHRCHTEVAADAALLEPAKGRFGVDAGMRVDAHHAALDRLGHAKGAPQVIRPERAAQTVGRGIHVTDHLRLIVERGDTDDRAEDFLAPTAVVLAHLKQDSRFEIIAFRAGAPAAAGEPAAALASVGEEFFDGRALGGGDQRAKLGFGLRRVANEEQLRRGNEPVHERLADAAFDEHTAAGAAILAGVGEDAHGRGLGRALPVGVGENDVG